MAILNTIHFTDEWITRFDESSTRPGDFTRADGQTVRADYMTRTEGMSAYGIGDGFASVQLHLKDGGTMTFVLPDAGRDVGDLFKTPERVAEVFSIPQDQKAKVVLKVPKFVCDSKYSLGPALQELGIQRAFGQSADFTGMSEGPLWIGQVLQDTHIAIDEKGVEAAAFTVMLMDGGAMQKELDTFEFSLTRPFAYCITTRGGTVLFMGVMYDPTQG